MKAAIINIGNELLDGKIRNGNAEFIMNELATIGVSVERQMVVIDDEVEIINALDINRDKDLILTTGGLGTTDDDKTRETVEKYLDDNKIEHQMIFMKNTKGYFDGVFYKYGKAGIMIFPGPPREMNTMLRNNLNLLIDKQAVSIRKTYRLAFLTEWDTHERLRNNQVSTKDVNTFVDSDGSVYLKLYMEDKSQEALDKAYIEVDNKIKQTLGPLIYANEDISRERHLINTLIDKNYSLACAESYTGGKIISSLIEIPDASKVIEEAFITYSNEAKNEILNVSIEDIDRYGVVSKEICHAMLKGLYEHSQADVCIATTGYAGPTGDVGSIYLGIRYKDVNYIFRHYMKHSRRWIMNKSKNLAIDYTYLIINDLLDAASDKIEMELIKINEDN